MKPASLRILTWTPRVLCLLFAGFIGIFSLDVLSADRSVGEKVVAFLIHNIPANLILVALALAWWRACSWQAGSHGGRAGKASRDCDRGHKFG